MKKAKRVGGKRECYKWKINRAKRYHAFAFGCTPKDTPLTGTLAETIQIVPGPGKEQKTSVLFIFESFAIVEPRRTTAKLCTARLNTRA